MPSWWFFFHVFEWGLCLVMALVILRRRLPTAAALAWLGMIYFLPIPGAFAYLLVGDHRLGRKRVRLHRAVINAMRSENWRSSQTAYIIRPKIEPAQLPMILQAERASGMPIVGGNSVELMPDNRAMIDRLIADINAAEHRVHLLYYIYEADDTGRRVAEAMINAVKRGVPCRLLADAAGSWGFLRGGLAEQLKQHGVEVEAMLPVRPLRRGLARIDLRNHRKLAVIDGTIAYTGSQNIVDDDRGHRLAGCWVDMSGRFTGPVVTQLQTVFMEDWAFETDEVLEITAVPKPTGNVAAQAVPTGPSHGTEDFQRVLLAAINSAQKEVIITSPYLIPDEATVTALSMAADRGAEVRLVLPRRSDHVIVSAAGRSYYPGLMEAGVKIYHYNTGLLHAKTVTVDDSFALMGSSNLDIRSFHLCFEISVLLYGPEITSELRRTQMCYIQESTLLEIDRWRRRPFYKTYLDNAAGLLSPLL